VYCTVHAKLAMAAVPCEDDVDRSVHVVERPLAARNAQTFVAEILCAGSNILKPAKTPASCVTVTV
jgi:hypothetical protein